MKFTINGFIIYLRNNPRKINKKKPNYKEIQLTEKKLKIPFEIEEKYTKSNSNDDFFDTSKQSYW